MSLIKQSPLSTSITGFLGFDDLMSRLEQDFSKSFSKLAYPPYNIKKEGGAYIIDVALAGFEKSEIEVKKDNEHLYISAVHKTGESNDNYLHRGIADRDAYMTFKLADGVVVRKVKFESGLLKVVLEQTETKNDMKTFNIE